MAFFALLPAAQAGDRHQLGRMDRGPNGRQVADRQADRRAARQRELRDQDDGGWISDYSITDVAALGTILPTNGGSTVVIVPPSQVPTYLVSGAG
jgi:hypothetical protein